MISFQRSLLTHLSYEIWSFPVANLSPTMSFIRNRREWGTQAMVRGIILLLIFYGERFKADSCKKDITSCCLIKMLVEPGVSWDISFRREVWVFPDTTKASKTPATSDQRLSDILAQTQCHSTHIPITPRQMRTCLNMRWTWISLQRGCVHTLCPLPGGTAAHITRCSP